MTDLANCDLAAEAKRNGQHILIFADPFWIFLCEISRRIFLLGDLVYRGDLENLSSLASTWGVSKFARC